MVVVVSLRLEACMVSLPGRFGEQAHENKVEKTNVKITVRRSNFISKVRI